MIWLFHLGLVKKCTCAGLDTKSSKMPTLHTPQNFYGWWPACKHQLNESIKNGLRSALSSIVKCFCFGIERLALRSPPIQKDKSGHTKGFPCCLHGFDPLLKLAPTV